MFKRYDIPENPPYKIYPRKFNSDYVPQEVSSKEELENIDWVSSFKDTPGFIGLFCSPQMSGEPDALMLVHEDEDNPGKTKHWVIGYIYGSGVKIGLDDYNNHIK